MILTAANPIKRLQSGAKVESLAALLDEHPEIWNTHRLRTANEGPHRHVQDIWVRCLDWQVMKNRLAAFDAPHESSWYPVADRFPLLRAWAEAMCHAYGGAKIGGVLITKIPAGMCVLPHIDHGWHARHYDKVALQIKANRMQEFCFETKRLVTEPGDVFTFDNQYTHWVTNPSAEDRITMICCIRREK